MGEAASEIKQQGVYVPEADEHLTSRGPIVRYATTQELAKRCGKIILPDDALVHRRRKV
jgi:hypothetical protein